MNYLVVAIILLSRVVWTSSLECNVCGEGKEVTNPDGKFMFPGQTEVMRCDTLEQAGKDGLVPPDQCAILPGILSFVCQCGTTSSTEPNDDEPPTITPNMQHPICNVCGDGGLKVGNSSGVLDIMPGVSPITCDEFQTNGLTGKLPPGLCVLAPVLIQQVCDCDEVTPGVPLKPSTPIPIQPSPPIDNREPCSVCGEGKQVTDPDGMIVFPGQPTVTCGLLEAAGREVGLIPSDECIALPRMIQEVCACRPIAPSSTKAPVSPSTVPIPPSPTGPPPTIVHEQCSVCGDGNKVGNPNAILTFPGQPPIPCDLLEQAGKDGYISPDQCPFLLLVIDETCDCRPIVATPSFTRSPSVSPPAEDAPQQPVHSSCNICGDGKELGDMDGLVVVPGQSIVSCSVLNLAAGIAGTFSSEQCHLLQTLVTDACQCSLRPVGDAPTTTTTTAGTNAVCSVCGEAKQVGNDAAVVNFPGLSRVFACAEIQERGASGQFSESQCALLPPLIEDTCECESIPAVLGPWPPCSVCGKGQQVGNANAMASIPDKDAIACGDFEGNGRNGLIQAGECLSTASFIKESCECQEIPKAAISAPAIITVAPVTFAPVALAPAPIVPLSLVQSSSSSSTSSDDSMTSKKSMKRMRTGYRGMMKA